MKNSCRAGLHRELLTSASATFHPAKRISGLHLKPYLKLQKKERSLEASADAPRSPPMSPQRLANEGKPSSTKPGLAPAPPALWRPRGGLPPDMVCKRGSGGGGGGGPGPQERGAALPATIHQGDEGEGPLEIWALVKPGNTREKVAFFAGQEQGGDPRASSVKSKSSWDIDGRATKRRKRSLGLQKAAVRLERMRAVGGRCFQPEPFACSVEHCSVHHADDGAEGAFPGRPLSVVEMVAFLEQRASVLLAGCAKSCPGASALTRLPGPPKGAPPAPGPFPAPEAHPEKAPGGGGGSGGEGEPPGEPLRVLDMVAKLESECLRQRSEREAGSLSRSNSFRRNVGRVLLASGAPPENEAGRGLADALPPEQRAGGEEGWRPKQGCSAEDPPAGPLPPCPEAPGGTGDHRPDRGDSAASAPCRDSTRAARPRPAAWPDVARGSPRSSRRRDATGDGSPEEPSVLLSWSPGDRVRESLSMNLAAPKAETDGRSTHPSGSGFGEDSLPGRLFLLLSECEIPPRGLSSGETPPEEGRGKAVPPAGDPCPRSRPPGEPPESPSEGGLQPPDASRLKRQRSHDFLETRFKIQQLLEPQQYLVFLPHHLIVKIFGLLPTRSLVALKCSCGYFKFIIEYYNVRPADSRWVRDPRYREDPCKQCKKTYTRGDVSLCRWHPKPYCQALPYGPGYWMCCHRSQKSVPGCRLGLHDNRWVPACHSFNRALHKKSRDPDEDC
ncbi:F-box only protein 34 [Varanus komodoensis]|uniref:F-box protein 34 n=1 Tax=Varanus komodoensis TaxID=61221 RepID=A0A8D2IMT9_VARKO|nr:F-box only protein 34 [Varanus komodoensis]XP_044291922.1 F-box only protein 34 [Varanus komodoensis]KAF7251883.1 F-box only protein 34 [Varanus komodoensis]